MEKTETQTTATETAAQAANTIEVTILGFNKVGENAYKVNTSPTIEVWLNRPEDYHTYKALVGKKAVFASRMVNTRAGKLKKVYDLNITELSESDIANIGADWGNHETEADASKPY